MSLFSAIQINSTSNFKENIDKVSKLIDKSVINGAKVIALPECFAYISESSEDKKEFTTNEIKDFLRNKAKENNIYLIGGSIYESIDTSSKVYNTSFLFSPKGEELAFYRKIHLFDVDIPNGATLKESNTFLAGEIENNIKVIKTEYGNFGLTICYDLRFPELFRELVKKGAEIIFVPSAFTMHTGKDHWEVLLRARAIENQVYIIAPGQYGKHNSKRMSYGNSMIIDPWGQVISRASNKEDSIFAEIDLNYLKKIRTELPCLKHIRLN